MSVTITGVFLIPLGLVLVFMPWRYCLAGLMVFAMMSPAAVVNYNNFGLEPGYYLALLVIARTFLSIMTKGYVLNGSALRAMSPLFYLVALAFLVLFVALSFFQGVDTLPGTAGFKSGAVQPFHLARNNFTQLVYLLVNICLIYSLAHQGARRGFETLAKDWDRAIFAGMLFAVTVSVWQFVSLYNGLYFPSDFFYSNAGYNRADSQTMLGLFRINGPFEEPSTLGYTFTGYLLFAWCRYRAEPKAFPALMIAGCIFCMLVSTSTTAFAGLALFAGLAGFDVLRGRVQLMPRRLSTAQMAALAAIGVGIVAGSFIAAGNWPEISLILDRVVFDKSESTSFQQRAFADFLAFQIFVETYGIGVGLGSHKANSLLLTLLSNLGVAGVLLFCGFIYRLFRVKTAPQYRQALSPFQWGLTGLLAVHLFSNPNLSVVSLWLQMGGVLALRLALRMTNVTHQDTAMEARTLLAGTQAQRRLNSGRGKGAQTLA